jgi:hypothetical protein
LASLGSRGRAEGPAATPTEIDLAKGAAANLLAEAVAASDAQLTRAVVGRRRRSHLKGKSREIRAR